MTKVQTLIVNRRSGNWEDCSVGNVPAMRMWIHIPSTQTERRAQWVQIPGAHWSPSTVEMGSSRFSDRPYFIKSGGKAVQDDTWCHPKLPARVGTQLHIFKCVYTPHPPTHWGIQYASIFLKIGKLLITGITASLFTGTGKLKANIAFFFTHE